MPNDDNQSTIPGEIANKAINRNIGIASRLPWLLVFVQAGRFDEASDLVNNLVSGLADADADLRTLRDAVTKAPGEVLNGELPYAYTAEHRCVLCDHPLRYPLVWNRTTKDTGEYICAVGECDEEDEGAIRHTFSNEQL